MARPSIRSTHSDVDHGDDTLNDLAMLGMLGSPEHSNYNLSSNQNESNKGVGYAPSSASTGSAHRNATDMMTSLSSNQVTGGAVDTDMIDGSNK